MSCHGPYDARDITRRAIVHDDHLEIAEGLEKNGLQTAPRYSSVPNTGTTIVTAGVSTARHSNDCTDDSFPNDA